MAKNNYTEIEGWCEEEITNLYDRAIREAKDGSVFVEIGCYKGKSTCYMIDAIKRSGKKISFYVFDNFSTLGDVEQEFLDNLGGDRLSRIKFLKRDSVVASRRFEDSSVDFVFIDTDHYASQLSKELIAWIPKMKPGGLVSGHDHHHNDLKDAFDIVGVGLYNVIYSKVIHLGEGTFRGSSWWFIK
jgi:predicted O-methyltransferase YrrM